MSATDRIARGLARLDARRRAVMTETVLYQRGDDSVSLPATIGRTVFEIVKQFGVETFESVDFKLTAADLVLDGDAVEPASGDRITRTRDGAEYTHEVLAPDGEHCFRRDAAGIGFRVHTKLVEGPTWPS